MNQYIFPHNYTPKEGDLSVWWIPQLPGRVFRVPVGTPLMGRIILDALARYDLFQLAENIRPDFSNAGGLDIFENGEWATWFDEDGMEIDELEAREGELGWTNEIERFMSARMEVTSWV